MSGSRLIAAERERQVGEEGWTAAHDDAHDNSEMVRAAACYLHAAYICDDGLGPVELPEEPSIVDWPWRADWWKPSGDPIRNLVKAGALIAAEIDRLQRAASYAHLDEAVANGLRLGDRDDHFGQSR